MRRRRRHPRPVRWRFRWQALVRTAERRSVVGRHDGTVCRHNGLRSTVDMDIRHEIAKKLYVPRIMFSRGLTPPADPRQLLKMIRIRSQFGSTAATGYALGNLRFPDREAIIDEAGS